MKTKSVPLFSQLLLRGAEMYPGMQCTRHGVRPGEITGGLAHPYKHIHTFMFTPTGNLKFLILLTFMNFQHAGPNCSFSYVNQRINYL